MPYGASGYTADAAVPIFRWAFPLEPVIPDPADLYGLRIDKLDDEICIRLDRNRGVQFVSLLDSFSDWQQQAEKYKSGIITKEEYDAWRYNYPKHISEE